MSAPFYVQIKKRGDCTLYHGVGNTVEKAAEWALTDYVERDKANCYNRPSFVVTEVVPCSGPIDAAWPEPACSVGPQMEDCCTSTGECYVCESWSEDHYGEKPTISCTVDSRGQTEPSKEPFQKINMDRDFKPLTDEEFRTYHFTDTECVTIVNPIKLHVSASGGHRVLDSKGRSHYIPAGWKHLEWQVKPGHPEFLF